jgi:putative nucleotidyltransferase with HDIG domain
VPTPALVPELTGSGRHRRPIWSVSDLVFVVLSCAAVAVAYRAAGQPAAGTAAAVLVAATLSMQARLAVGPAHAVALGLIAAAAVAALGAGPGPAATTFAAAATGAWLAARFRRRARVLWAAAGVGGVAVALSIVTASRAAPMATVLADAAMAGGAGLASPLLRLAIEPLCDVLFGHATRLTLSEWLDLEHPLLRELARVAPGTLQHSVNVGVLAAAAARAIRADALLAHVGGLYHDVGKAAAPEYFYENQAGRNPHDELDPRHSARVLRQHVADGVERVLAHGMGQRIADFVREHHGTGSMRALEAKAAAGGSSAIDPGEFRYPGPRPRSVETAILMLADQIEATARADAPSDLPACERIVRRTVDRVRAEGELGDAGIGERQLATVERALARALHAMHHRRLAYPPARLGPPAGAAAGV